MLVLAKPEGGACSCMHPSMLDTAKNSRAPLIRTILDCLSDMPSTPRYHNKLHCTQLGFQSWLPWWSQEGQMAGGMKPSAPDMALHSCGLHSMGAPNGRGFFPPVSNFLPFSPALPLLQHPILTPERLGLVGFGSEAVAELGCKGESWDVGERKPLLLGDPTNCADPSWGGGVWSSISSTISPPCPPVTRLG